jgi:hypothetical protein
LPRRGGGPSGSTDLTDSPTSGMPRPSGAPAGDTPTNGGSAFAPPAAAVSDASKTLAELERKLHELERDLTAMGSVA